jgi:hypothetical protein
MSKFKLDIFETLAAVDSRNFDFLQSKSDDERKAFAPVVVMRWASAITDGKSAGNQIVAVNEKVNKDFWDIADHPDLQFRLMASAGMGRKQRHEWIANAKADKSSNKLISFIQSIYPEYNDMEANIVLSKFNIDSFKYFLVSCAVEEKEEKDLLNAFKAHLKYL